MTHSLRCTPRSLPALLRTLLFGLLLVAASSNLVAQQLNICDSLLRVSARSLGQCCFAFTLSNYQRYYNIKSVEAYFYSNAGATVTVGSVSGPSNASAGKSGNRAFWYYSSAAPYGTSDSLVACVSSTAGQYYVVFNWRDSTHTICSDTLKLDCSTKPSGCLAIAQTSITCLDKANTYRLNFNLTNNSSFSASYLYFFNRPGFTVTNSLMLSPALAPGGTRTGNSINIYGPAPGSTITIPVQICSDSLGRNCCTDSIKVTLPQCQSVSGCFQIVTDSIFCNPNGAVGYTYSFKLKNNASWSATSLSIQSVSPSGVTVSPTLFTFPALASGSTLGTRTMNVSGAGATPGTTVVLVARMCSSADSANGGVKQQCCTDTIRFKLPQCGSPNTGGCFKIVQSYVYCDSSTNGYRWCFGIANGASFKARYMYITPVSSAVVLTPGSVSFNLNPGSTYTQCVGITGAAAGTMTVYIRLCDSTLKNCCVDTFTVKLPECGSHPTECCANFPKKFSRLVNSASSSGFASLSGSLSAGSGPLKSVSATIVSATINGLPAYDYVNAGLISNPFGPGIVIPPPYGAEIRWSSSGTLMSALTPFYLSLKFPPIAANLKSDTLRYCIRFRYTDVNCVTCDTLLCFERIRYRFFGINGFGRTEKKDGDNHVASAGGSGISGSLTGPDAGTMKIDFPIPPKELGGVTYTGLRINAEIPIMSVTSDRPDVNFTNMGGTMSSDFSVAPSNSLSLNLAYSGLGSRTAVEHHVILRYVVANSMDTLEEEVVVTLSKGTGGDALQPDYSNYANVKTYALHLKNANPSGEKVDRLVITSSGGVKIVAIGPTIDDSRTVLQFGKLSDGTTERNFVGEVVGGGLISVPPGAIQGPIYLTLAGVDEELWTATVHFATLNANDQVLSEGDLLVSDPMSGVDQRDGGAGTGGISLQAYPNPSTESATIRFTLPNASGNATLLVTDAKGREVARLVDGETLQAGEHVAFLKTGELASGTYFYTLRTAMGTVTRSMQVVK
jgi:hypothetical protein